LSVGAVGESDHELLETVRRAHCELGLWRAYFSAFHPIERLPFSDLPAEDLTRALRLYQSDFMTHDYGFTFTELPFDEHRDNIARERINGHSVEQVGAAAKSTRPPK
jgi:predicted DNA-binding helix-hairpin-helix protein